jgi:protein-disulfide isomerase
MFAIHRRSVLTGALAAVALSAVPAFAQDIPTQRRGSPSQSQSQPQNQGRILSEAEIQAIMPDRSLGSKDALLTVWEYSSFTCPHCARFHSEILPVLKSEYIDTGRVRLVYRDFPLDRAGLAIAMVARAMTEDKFFPFIDAVFRNQSSWGASPDVERAIRSMASLAGINGEAFEKALKRTDMVDALLSRRKLAEDAGIRGTPSFVIGRSDNILVGARPVDDFRSAFNKELANK